MVLTSTAQVLDAVSNGARVEPCPDAPNLLRLVDADGGELRAWQTALKAAQAKTESGR